MVYFHFALFSHLIIGTLYLNRSANKNIYTKTTVSTVMLVALEIANKLRLCCLH